MAGTPDDSGYPGDASGFMNPELTKLVGSFQTPEGQKLAADATSDIQDYLTTRTIAKNAQDAQDAFVNNLHETKTNLIGMVQNDPGAMPLALDKLAPKFIGAIADEHELPDEHAGSLLDHMQGEIAHAGISKLAELDKGRATEALSQFGDYLPDGAAGDLQRYIDTQDGLRQQDAHAQQLQAARGAANTSLTKGSQYLSALTDENGRLQFPPGFSSKVFADMDVSTPTKVALHAAYVTLQHNGDVRDSHPDVLSDFASRIADGNPPPQGEVFSHVGRGLSLADAGYFGNLLGPQSPAQRATAQQFADTLGSARDAIATPNGPAGQIAYGRFTSWLMNGLHNGGNLTDMMADDNVLQRFASTADDVRQTMPVRRMPLDVIFGRSA